MAVSNIMAISLNGHVIGGWRVGFGIHVYRIGWGEVLLLCFRGTYLSGFSTHGVHTINNNIIQTKTTKATLERAKQVGGQKIN